MKKVLLSLVAVAGLVSANPVQSIDLGAIASKGKNSSAIATASAKYKYENTFGDIKFSFKAEAYGGKSEGKVSDERYSLDTLVQKEFQSGWLGYAKAGWMKDRVKLGLENKFTAGLGGGKLVINNASQKLDLKLGVAYVNNKYYDTTKNNDYTGLEESVKYTYTISDTSKVYAKLNAVEDFSNFSDVYDISASAGIELAVSKNISMKFEYQKDYSHSKTSIDYTDRTLAKLSYKF